MTPRPCYVSERAASAPALPPSVLPPTPSLASSLTSSSRSVGHALTPLAAWARCVCQARSIAQSLQSCSLPTHEAHTRHHRGSQGSIETGMRWWSKTSRRCVLRLDGSYTAVPMTHGRMGTVAVGMAHVGMALLMCPCWTRCRVSAPQGCASDIWGHDVRPQDSHSKPPLAMACSVWPRPEAMRAAKHLPRSRASTHNHRAQKGCTYEHVGVWKHTVLNHHQGRSTGGQDGGGGVEGSA